MDDPGDLREGEHRVAGLVAEHLVHRARPVHPLERHVPVPQPAAPAHEGQVDALVRLLVDAVGGLGAHVLTMASDAGLIDSGLKLRTLRLPDTFQDHDKPEKQYADAGLDAELLGIDAFPDMPDVEETGATFAANALLKAAFFESFANPFNTSLTDI